MASINAFIDMIKEFTLEMSKAFPKNKKIKDELERIKSFTDVESQAFLESFTTSMKASGKYITAKNPKIFKRGRSEFFDNIQLYKIWKENTRKSVKDAIWNYLQTLQVLSTTLTALPPAMMTGIEEMAQKAADNMLKSGVVNDGQMDMSKLDLNSIMKDVQGLMGSIDKDELEAMAKNMQGMEGMMGGLPGMGDMNNMKGMEGLLGNLMSGGVDGTDDDDEIKRILKGTK